MKVVPSIRTCGAKNVRSTRIILFLLALVIAAGAGTTGAYANDGVCTETPGGLVGWWPLDEASGLVSNDQIGTNNGAHTGGPSIIPGKVVNALRFNGANMVTVPDDATLDMGAGDFSVDAWVKPDDILSGTAGVRTIVDKRGLVGGKETGYSVYLWKGRLGVRLADGVPGHNGGGTNYPVPDSMTIPVDNNWHFVGVSVSRAGGIDFRVDGNTYHQDYWPDGIHTASLTNAADLLIGGHYDIFPGGSAFLGDIDEVELFNMALSDAELKSIYDAGSNGKCKECALVAPAGLLGWWTLDDTPTISSIVGNHDGSMTGTPVPTSIAGEVAGALSFNGSNSVNVPDDNGLDIDTGDFSVDAWVKPSDSTGVRTIVDKRGLVGGKEIGYHIFLWNGRLGIRLADGAAGHNGGGTNYPVPASMSIAADSNWHFVSVSVNRTTGIDFRVDGTTYHQDYWSDGVHTNSLANPAALLIGGHHSEFGGGGAFLGGLDEVELFGRAVPDSEFQKIFEAGTLGKCKDTIRALPIGGSGSVNVSVPDGYNLLNVGADPSHVGGPQGISFPFGTISYAIGNVPVGGSVTTTFYFSQPINLDNISLYKINEAGDVVGTIPPGDWELDPTNKILTVTIQDGGPADLDGVANGVIVDPLGIGGVSPATGINSTIALLIGLSALCVGLAIVTRPLRLAGLDLR